MHLLRRLPHCQIHPLWDAYKYQSSARLSSLPHSAIAITFALLHFPTRLRHNTFSSGFIESRFATLQDAGEAH